MNPCTKFRGKGDIYNTNDYLNYRSIRASNAQRAVFQVPAGRQRRYLMDSNPLTRFQKEGKQNIVDK